MLVLLFMVCLLQLEDNHPKHRTLFLFTCVCPSFRTGKQLLYIYWVNKDKNSLSCLNHFLGSDSNVGLNFCCTLTIFVNFDFTKSFGKKNSCHEVSKHSHLLICFMCKGLLVDTGSMDLWPLAVSLEQCRVPQGTGETALAVNLPRVQWVMAVKGQK